MISILHVAQNWWAYLLGNHFYIKSDQKGPEYFLEQQVSSSTQYKWVRKVMFYDYEIIYKKGKETLVADSLSCTFDDHVSPSAISMPILN